MKTIAPTGRQLRGLHERAHQPQIQVPSLHPWTQPTPHLHSPASVPLYASEKLKSNKIRSLHVIQFMALEITLLLWCGLLHPFYLSFDFSLTSQCVSGANESTEESSRQYTNIYMSDSKDHLHSGFVFPPTFFFQFSTPLLSSSLWPLQEQEDQKPHHNHLLGFCLHQNPSSEPLWEATDLWPPWLLLRSTWLS